MQTTEPYIVNGAAVHAAPTRGRTAPTFPTVIVPSSGREVRIRRQPADIIPRLRAAAEQELIEQRPQPPVQLVETGPGDWQQIANEADESYQQALREWLRQIEQRVGEKSMELVERIGIIYDGDPAEIEQLRDDYAALGVVLEGDDRTVWLHYIVAPAVDDWKLLLMEVIGKSFPQEMQVQMHRAMFSGDVRGAGHLEANASEE